MAPGSQEQQTLACLLLNNKTYPIYDGYNPIGRNPSAVVNLKNVNVSKNHAMITVLEQNTHYLGDLRSSNGTFINSEQLEPLKLYKLTSGVSIKFGDVSCTYKILAQGEKTERHNASQEFTQNFYSAGTQEVADLPPPEDVNFNELPTQMFTEKHQNIHELPTQIFAEKSLNINEMPTQIYDFSNIEDSSNDSMDLMKAAKDSQGINSEKTNGTSSTEIVPVGLHNRKILDSDSEREPLLSQIKPVQTGRRNIIDSDSESEPDCSNKNSKYHISDDSETDIESDKEEKAEKKEESQKPNSVNEAETSFEREKMSKKVIPSDHHYCQALLTQDENGATHEIENVSRVDDESDQKDQVKDATNVQNDKDSEATLSYLQEPTKDTTFDAASSKEKDEDINLPTEDKDSEETLPDLEEQISKEATFEAETSKEENVSRDLSQKEEKDTEELPNLQDQTNEENTFEAASSKQEIWQKEDKKSDETLPETLTLDVSSIQRLEDMKDTENEQNVDHAEQQKQAKEKETLTLDVSSSKEHEQSKETENEEDVFDQATQQLSTEILRRNESQKQEENEDIFLLPTQTLDFASAQKSKDDSSLQPTQQLSNDLDYLPPTQSLEILHGKDENNSSKVNLNVTNEEDFLPSTQALQNILEDRSPKDVFLCPPSPFKKSKLALKKIKDVEEDILQPTQALEQMHKGEEKFHTVDDQMHEIFASQSILCTQELVEALNVTGDVIDDSLMQEASISKDCLEDILSDAIEKKESPVLTRSGEKKTYSKRKNEVQDTSSKTEISVSESLEKSTKNEDSGMKPNEVRKAEKQNKVTIKEDEKLQKAEEVDTEDEFEQSVGKLATKPSSRKQRKREKSPLEDLESKEGPSSSKKGRIEENTIEQNDEKQSSGRTRRSKATLLEEAVQSKTAQKKAINTENQETKTSTRKKTQKETTTETDDSETASVSSETSTRSGRNRKTESQSSNESISTRSLRRNNKMETPIIEEDGPSENRKVETKIEADKVNSTRKGRKRKEDTNSKVDTPTNGRATYLNRTRNKRNIDKIEDTESDTASISSEVSTRGRKRKEPLKETPITNVKENNNDETPTNNLVASTSSNRTRSKQISDKADTESDMASVSSEISAKRGRKKKQAIIEETEETPSRTKTRATKKRTLEIEIASNEAEVKRTRRLSANSRQKQREQKQLEILTPERERRILKPKVVFTMLDNPKLVTLVKKLGGSVIEDVNNCTVLVTENVKRSQKLLCAVALSKPICSPQWILDSQKNNAFVDPWDYILVDKEAEKKWDFSLRESLIRSGQRRLLEDYTFQVIVDKAADVIEDAIEACGGKVVSRNLPKCTTTNLVIVSAENKSSSYRKIAKQNSRIIVVQAEAIFDGTLTQELNFDRYLLH